VVERRISGWRLLREATLEGLDAWSTHHLDKLADLERGSAEAVGGNTLLHFDVRADNILLDAEHVWFFDWPHACIGAPWFDVIGFAPSVAMQGGPQPEVVLRRYPGAAEADPQAVTAAVAAVAGFFTRDALLPPPPGLPTLRAFQAAQGVIARRWLAERTGWHL
jgi:Ser/Thr protein kinase RdoA (MazF antagonist)